MKENFKKLLGQAINNYNRAGDKSYYGGIVDGEIKIIESFGFYVVWEGEVENGVHQIISFDILDNKKEK